MLSLKVWATPLQSLHSIVSLHGILPEFKDRILKIYTETQNQNWLYEDEFSRALDIID